jgi:hypothetical protein
MPDLVAANVYVNNTHKRYSLKIKKKLELILNT